jgi:hypothetical protein
MIEESVNVAVASCPECWTLLLLDRPSQALHFPCPTCLAALRIVGGFLEALAYGNSNRLHHLTER